MIKGDWYITMKAVEDYCALRGWDSEDDELFVRAEDELLEIAATAHLVMRQDNGLLQYRTGRKYGRIRLLVSDTPRPEGEKNQVVAVLPSHA